jgi:D-alanyl-lipoteichoic acid acyltransferase DltB (MBOAT superfamily)
LKGRRPGDGVIGENAALQKTGRGVQIVRVCFTFLLVSFAWVFFRANTIADAFLIFRKFTSLPAELAGYITGLPERGIVNTVGVAFHLSAANQEII